MAFKMTPKSPALMATGRFGSPAKNMNKGYGPAETSSPAKQMSQLKTKSPAKQKRTMDQAYAKRDMDIYGDLDKNEYKKEALRQNKVKAGKKELYTKLGDGTMQTKKDKFGNTDLNTPSLEPNMRNTKGESMNSGNTGGRKITGDVPSTKMKSKTKKVTTVKAGGRLEGGKEVKNKKAALPTAKPIEAKEIKVTKKVAEAKPTRSQKIRAKGEAALASGKTDKAQRLRRRYDRTEAREEKRAGRKAARAEKKNKMAMTKSKVDKKAKSVKKKAMDSSRMEN
jgi:hypothetical protein